MKHFNLSGWSVNHPALILFLIVALGVAGFFSYQKLGRGEDPYFTVKVVNVSAIWPGHGCGGVGAPVSGRFPF